MSWILNCALRLPEFQGKWRVVSFIRGKPNRNITRMENGVLLDLDQFEWAQLALAQYGVTEPLTMKLITKILNKGDTFIDVGAHVGFVSLAARQAIGESGRVIAIEPQPYNCERLLRNWELNNFTNLELHVAAAGDQQKFVQLPQQLPTDKSRLSLCLPMPSALDLNFCVPMRTLESIINESSISSVRLLKIDVEGFELQVLQGLAKAIDKVDFIVFEALNGVEDREANERVCNWLDNRGFRIMDIRENDWSNDYPIVENNLFATRFK